MPRELLCGASLALAPAPPHTLSHHQPLTGNHLAASLDDRILASCTKQAVSGVGLEGGGLGGGGGATEGQLSGGGQGCRRRRRPVVAKWVVLGLAL